MATQDVGTGQTYTTPQAWEDALPGTLTEPEIGEGLAEEFTGALNMSGVTTSAANYAEFRAKAGARHDGRAHDVSALGNCRINHSGAVATIQANLNYCRIAWMDIKGPGNNAFACIVVDNVTTSAVYIHHNIIHNNGANAGANPGLLLDDGSAFVAYVYNNIIYGFGADGIRITAVDAGSLIYNNTIAFCNVEGSGVAAGIRANVDTDPVIKNNALFSNQNLDLRGTEGTIDYNATSDATGDDEGANGIPSLTTTDQFVSGTSTYSTIDLLLKAGADIIGEGEDLSGSGLPDAALDITGATRSGAWDIGASQYDSPVSTPSISSAAIVAGVMTITGTGFGTKATAAPFKFQPFVDTEEGDDYADAGFDIMYGGSELNHVDMSDGIGGGSWLYTSPGGGEETFTYFGHTLEDVDEIFVSHWVRIRRMTVPTQGGDDGQYKGVRAGIRTGSDPSANMYILNPKYSFSTYSDVEDTDSLSGPDAYTYNAPTGLINTYFPEGNYNVPLISNTWQYCEVHYKFNDLGQANGIQRIRFNGTQHVDLTNMQPRTDAGEFIGYVQYCPSLAGSLAYAEFEARFSRIYLDTTPARAFLGNASTLAACTGRFMISPSAWSSTEITAGSASLIPYGYDWLYVVNADGEYNSSGFEYTPEDVEESTATNSRTGIGLGVGLGL